jgi:TrmH family RNA methyltransferase
VLLSLGTVEVLNPKVVRATMGSLFHIPVVENVELANELKRSKERDYKVYVTDLQGKAEYSNVDFSCKSVVVFGNEAWGVAPGITELADLTIRISQIGRADSLNVAVACGVILSRAQMH